MLSNAKKYLLWIDSNQDRGLPTPDTDGLFRLGSTRCVFPLMRVFYKGSERPKWNAESWTPSAEEEPTGWTRYFRADQLLQWTCEALRNMALSEHKISEQLRWLMTHRWLIGVEHPLQQRLDILEGRVEVLRVLPKKNTLRWYRDERAPEYLRNWHQGLDPIHTPESMRSGFSRYLAHGWHVGDYGQLISSANASKWGVAALYNAHRLSVAPRRLMLGANIVGKAIPIGGDPAIAATATEGSGPGALRSIPLRIAISTHDGWTHEDALVVSENASERLARHEVLELYLRVPAIAGRVELASPGMFTAGQRIARAYIDAYALGIRKGEDGLPSDGWIEIFVPGAVLRNDCELVGIREERQEGTHWRSLIRAYVRLNKPLHLGDKLATHHGIKGVVSRILPAENMPVVGTLPADLVMGPLSIENRAAYGQLKEMGVLEPKANTLTGGIANVMRMPNDASDGLRVCGGNQHKGRGHRYGEMEFYALLAHGCTNIAHEILSKDRCTDQWMQREITCGAMSGGDATARAISRFLSVVGITIDDEPLYPRIVGGQLKFEKGYPDAHEISIDKFINELLTNTQEFEKYGLLAVKLPSVIKIELPLNDKQRGGDFLSLRLDRIHILPPWLRPDVQGRMHPLTTLYVNIIRALARGSDWSDPASHKKIFASVHKLILGVLSDDIGIGGFLRSHVLGRRLNRSASAVVIPRPDLRIDQVAIPAFVLEKLFEGLPKKCRELVLVNRYPTLHRFGMLALRPIATQDNEQVIGLPLGVLRALGADFDGDHATIVALTSNMALEEARGLLPSAPSMRASRHRLNDPAVFRFSRELHDAKAEDKLALMTELSTKEWSEKHFELQQKRIKQESGRGLDQLAALLQNLSPSGDEKLHIELWNSMPEQQWQQQAEKDMRKVFSAVKHKGKFGGVLRRELYRLPYDEGRSREFSSAVQALQTITERLTQSALDVKKGSGIASFSYNDFFKDPSKNIAMLSILDTTLNARRVIDDLGILTPPSGLLGWFSKPSRPKLVELLREVSQSEGKISAATSDPRIMWFLQ